MGMFDHWHPVFPAHKLKKKRLAEITLGGSSICLYRGESGAVGAINNVCPHRRLKLTYGKIIGDKVECRYHGWQFDACGEGESRSTPKMHTCTDSYTTREEHGYIWIKSSQSNPEFPLINEDKFYHVGNFQHTIPAPLELTVDNFNEIEHSGTVHDTFGYDLEHLADVKVTFEQTDDSVTVKNVGITKKLFKPFAWGLGIGKDYLFHDHWTTRFSPVYSVFDHWWTSADGKKEGMFRWRLYIFFWPIDEHTTAATSFVYAKGRYPGPTGGLKFAKYILRPEVDREIRQDIKMLEYMGDKSVDITGMKLSRFDKVLGLTRERINRIYRGIDSLRIPLAG